MHRKAIIYCHDFLCEAASWERARQTVGEVEWHQRETAPAVTYQPENTKRTEAWRPGGGTRLPEAKSGLAPARNPWLGEHPVRGGANSQHRYPAGGEVTSKNGDILKPRKGSLAYSENAGQYVQVARIS